MAAKVLPDTPDAFKNASWQDILPYYEDLATRPLEVANVEEWLADWSRFESLLSEAAALANFAYSCDTADTTERPPSCDSGLRSRPARMSSEYGSRQGSWSSTTYVPASKR